MWNANKPLLLLLLVVVVVVVVVVVRNLNSYEKKA